jgi:hypothetical protein
MADRSVATVGSHLTQYGIRFTAGGKLVDLWMSEAQARLISSASPNKIRVITRVVATVIGPTRIERSLT